MQHVWQSEKLCRILMGKECGNKVLMGGRSKWETIKMDIGRFFMVNRKVVLMIIQGR